MDAFNEPSVHVVVFMKPTQVGATEIKNNVISYFIDQDPCNIFDIEPTLEKGEQWSKLRFMPMVNDTPRLREKIKDVKSRQSNNTIMMKSFPGGFLNIAGANSPQSLRGLSVRVTLCDDVDAFPASAGVEGDPIELVHLRAANFWDRKHYIASSPTEEHTSRIKHWYDASDQRKFWVPCPECGELQILKWKQVKWPDQQPHKAEYECEHCSVRLNDLCKINMVKLGLWRAEKPTVHIAGFWINKLYSPWVSFYEIAEDFLRKKQNKETLRVWVNTTLAETWVDKKSEMVESNLMFLKDSRPRGLVPSGISSLICLVDTQQHGFYYEVVAFGWGQNLESWQIREGFVETWAGLKDILYHDDYLDAAGEVYKIQMAFIDSGGGTGTVPKHSRTAEVYKFCRQNPGVKPLKGRQTMTKPCGVTTLDHFPGSNKVIPGGLSLYIIDVTYFKNQLATKLSIKPDDPGAWHLHSEVTEDYIRQLCSEYQDDHGKWQVWSGRDNHYWDLGVYRLAAAHIMRIGYRSRQEEGIETKETGRRVYSKGINSVNL